MKGEHKLKLKKTHKVKVAQSCPTVCDPMDYTVHGILQARILACVAFAFSSGSSQPRDRTQVSHTAGRFFTSWATRELKYELFREKDYLKIKETWQELPWQTSD